MNEGLIYSQFQKKIYKVSVFKIHTLRFPLILAVEYGRYESGNLVNLFLELTVVISLVHGKYEKEDSICKSKYRESTQPDKGSNSDCRLSEFSPHRSAGTSRARRCCRSRSRGRSGSRRRRGGRGSHRVTTATCSSRTTSRVSSSSGRTSLMRYLGQ